MISDSNLHERYIQKNSGINPFIKDLKYKTKKGMVLWKQQALLWSLQF